MSEETGPSSVEEAVSLALLARHVAYMVTGHRPDPES